MVDFLHMNPLGTTFVQEMPMSIRPLFTAIALALTLAGAAPALAQTPDEFVQTGHHQLEALLKQPASAQRDAQIASTFDQMVDYSELVRRCFKEHWTELDAAKQGEVSDLLKQIVRMNYKKRLKDTLNFNVTYTGVRGQGTEVVVRTQAHSLTDVRAPAVQVDYVVAGPTSGPFHVVDIIAENSSTVNNYYRDFHRFLTDASKGYPYLVQKLKNKVACLQSSSC
jgi:ABC-type transporter MlaC component